MPSQTTVLVTGASGFIATHVVDVFLKKGYNVRGTVRSEKSAAAVREAHKQYAEQLSTAIVPDLAAPGAFDEAVKGVDGVIHTASPFPADASDYEKELFEPAINGTKSILAAVQANSPAVKRVVITASFADVLDPTQGRRPGYVYTEADWNPIKRDDTISDAVVAYLASKTFAEQAAFDYVKDNKPNFSVTTVAPPMVYGPLLHSVTDASSLNTSAADIYRLFNGTSKEVPVNAFWAFADVRDVAQAHLLSYENSAAAGQRYLVSTSGYTYQQICDIIRANFPELVNSTPKGDTGAALPPVYKLDTSKSVSELGVPQTPLKDTIVDMVKSLQGIKA